MGKDLTRKEAQKIIDKFAKTLPNTTDKALYIGEKDSLYIFFIKRTVKGNHLGSPLYFSVDKDRNISQVEDGKILFYAMTSYNKLRSY